MSIDVVIGAVKNRSIYPRLIDQVQQLSDSGTLYIGYLLPATADSSQIADALLVSNRGVFVFRFLNEDSPNPQRPEDVSVLEDQYFAVSNLLEQHASLRQGRKLAFHVHTILVLPDSSGNHRQFNEVDVLPVDQIFNWISAKPNIDAELLRPLLAAIQRVRNYKPVKKREDVNVENSMGWKLKTIEREIANLDKWQQKAALEVPDGPQRIRGLAGSGKTVVLALKAALMHSQHPEWNIAVVFWSRSLYQQFEDLVTRFSFEYSGDRPNLEKLQILHAWGASDRPGLYSSMANMLGVTPRDYAYAVGKYGRRDPFQGICSELLDFERHRPATPVFDAVLIDEAQDLPPGFFQLVIKFIGEPKRVIWAYDELQRLSDSAMPSTDQLFGLKPDGSAIVTLNSTPDGPQRDIVLERCYRNPPWIIATAHSFGIGVYAGDQVLQHFDEPQLWSEVGYDVERGTLELGELVKLRRSPNSYPEYFDEHLKKEDVVTIHSFESEEDHDFWLATTISKHIELDEIDLDDMLVILPEPYTSQSRYGRLKLRLDSFSVPSHLVGVSSNTDKVFRQGSLAVTHIFRAKGNEAPMVFTIDTHEILQSLEPVVSRNKLFTAITRSRAWARISGWGGGMDQITDEFQKLESNDFSLEFRIPSASELAKLRTINREMSRQDVTKIKRAATSLDEVLAAIEQGELNIERLPLSTRQRLKNVFKESFPDVDNSKVDDQ